MKLLALDSEDLTVISAMCQDSVLKVGDIQYLPKEKRLIVAMNRFAWDADTAKQQKNERRRSVLALSRVEALQVRNIKQENKDGILSLLAITFDPDEDPAGRLTLEFSGGAVMAAKVECIEAQLTDLGAAWGTENRPHHELD
ncbi:MULTISPECIES: DUF2948 family protein [Pseudovibrio]|uniref:DUF2948 family protein n=1 Tax=Stappiaceae TaxID=2821832 RepID=UPI0023650036|nr:MULTISPECIES: DUF2948 family protein [Pseudovibrio]MDD7911088.1 DUF2948 family protein [Pseudovibrio exalbescens]MDX5595701.1 DUF2948 family protein [Pseudovibrio sp. SPO723]